MIHLGKKKKKKIASHNDQIPLTSDFDLKKLDSSHLCICSDATATQGSLAVQGCSSGVQLLHLAESM